jgi:Lrp/AsnC family transcriptional regulator
MHGRFSGQITLFVDGIAKRQPVWSILVSQGVFCESPSPRFRSTFNGLEGPSMDAIDRKILVVLQKDSNISIAELADQVGLSQTPCWKRVQKLEAAGIILGRVALVSPEMVGLGLTVFVQIETDQHSGQWLENFAGKVSGMPEVMEFYRMAGDVDYMLRVVVADMAAYDQFYKRLIEAFPLKNVTSRFAMERIKATTAYDIPPVAARR